METKDLEIRELRRLISVMKINASKLELERDYYKQSFIACQKLMKNYEDVKRFLSMTGDNPEDYIDELLTSFDDEGEQGVNENV